jgi:hypothetical protein
MSVDTYFVLTLFWTYACQVPFDMNIYIARFTFNELDRKSLQENKKGNMKGGPYSYPNHQIN